MQEVERQSLDLMAAGRELQNKFVEHAVALQQRTERMQEVTRAFRTRVARQKEVVLRSLNFYRILTEVLLIADYFL